MGAHGKPISGDLVISLVPVMDNVFYCSCFLATEESPMGVRHEPVDFDSRVLGARTPVVVGPKNQMEIP